MDKGLAKLLKMDDRSFKQVVKGSRQAEKFLDKIADVSIDVAVWQPSAPPAAAADETDAYTTFPPELFIDLLVTSHEPGQVNVRRIFVGGFADGTSGDVTVDLLDVAGLVVATDDVTPAGGRWMTTFAPGTGGARVVRATQGGPSVSRAVGSP